MQSAKLGQASFLVQVPLKLTISITEFWVILGAKKNLKTESALLKNRLMMIYNITASEKEPCFNMKRNQRHQAIV